MAPPLKDRLGRDAIESIARDFARAWPRFEADGFVAASVRGLSPLALLDRARHVAAALDERLPPDDDALPIFVRALGQPLADGDMGSLAMFVHSAWLERRARTADFDAAMSAARELTCRFTSELAIRPLLARDPERALAWLWGFALDDDPHVRRLVSEGTRPRLPWAARLTAFAPGYEPVIELLDALKDDPSLYVRRSVANHVGDLAKEDVDLAVQVCRGWARDPRPDVQWVVRHALRHPLKQGHPAVLALFGHAEDPRLEVQGQVSPSRAARGEAVTVAVTLANPHTDARAARVDLVVHFVKAGGGTSPKVFRLRDVELAPGERTELKKRVSLADLSTRQHYAGTHRVGVQINGTEHAVGSFELR